MYNPKAHQFLRGILPQLRKEAGSKNIEEFEARLHAIFPGIYSRFLKLYASKTNVDEHLKGLLSSLLQSYLQRPAALRKLDETREKDTGWFRSEKLTGMQLYVDRFNKDLKHFPDKLDYLEELGINYIHMMPVLKSPVLKNDGGYAVSDYRTIDPKFGTNTDFKNVVKSLKKKDMLLMIDLVVNHTSDEHEWAQRAKAGEKEFQDYYYTFTDRNVPDIFEQTMPQVFPETAPGNFTYSEEMQKWVMTVFNTYQWDLNYTNPKVLTEMIEVVLFLANLGVDVFRMDAVAFVWKQLGTSSQNLDQAHIIHQLIKQCAQVVAPGVAFLAEAIVAPEEIVKYFGESEIWSNEHDIAYNATLMALLWNSISTRSAKILKAGLRDFPDKPKGTTWINYIRCHDDIGLGFGDNHIAEAGFNPFLHRKFITQFLTGKFEGSFAKGLPFMYNPINEDARVSGSLASLSGLEGALEGQNELAKRRAIDRINMLHGIILAYGGIPMIYYGDEIGTLNDYSFTLDPSKMDDNRWMHRPIIDWEKVELRKKKGTVEHELFTTLQKMIAVRKESPEFEDDNNIRLVETGNDETLAFLRFKGYKSTLVIANFKDTDQEVYAHVLFPQTGMQHGRLIDKITGKKVSMTDGRLRLKPYQFYWLTNEI
uniref:alpha-amylase family glycosyl hydrolase n=1 Tax=Roseivirga sp. TaxID=1964215 RepID=UPI0040488DA4